MRSVESPAFMALLHRKLSAFLHERRLDTCKIWVCTVDLFCQVGKRCYLKDIWATAVLKVSTPADGQRRQLQGWALQGL